MEIQTDYPTMQRIRRAVASAIASRLDVTTAMIECQQRLDTAKTEYAVMVRALADQALER